LTELADNFTRLSFCLFFDEGVYQVNSLSYTTDQWKQKVPTVEVVTAEFMQEAVKERQSLFFLTP
jgi:hypothetical protein